MHTDDTRPTAEHRAADYDLAERAALVGDLAALRQSLSDSTAGKGRDAKEVLRDIAARIGVTIER